MDVSEAIVLREHFAEERLRFVVLALFVVLASEKEHLLDSIVHQPGKIGHTVRLHNDNFRRAVDTRTVLAVLLGTCAIACVAGPFAALGQRNAPKPATPATVTHSVVSIAAVEAEPAPSSTESIAPLPHTFRVADLATDSHTSIVTGTVGKHPFLAALAASGMSNKEQRRVLAGFAGVKNLDRCDARDAFTYATADGRVIAFEFIPAGAMDGTTFDFFQAREDAASKLPAARVSIPVQRKRITAGVVVGADLRTSLASAGLNEHVETLLDDALDGHADLADLRAGTRLRIVATEERIENAFAGYAPIDAIEYTPIGKPSIRVYWFKKGSSEHSAHGGYYDGDGRQPYHGGWRSPVPMARISSRFDPNRMHPVLHVVMPHNGVDFAAPSGTPVYAAAAGTIRSVGDGGPCGNMVQIDHPNGLTTAYCHLSKFGPISPGQHVETRQLIAYVGQTGRATGPHLHFAVKRGDVFLNPLSMKLDGVRIVPPRLRPEFDALKHSIDAEVDAIGAQAPEHETIGAQAPEHETEKIDEADPAE